MHFIKIGHFGSQDQIRHGEVYTLLVVVVVVIVNIIISFRCNLNAPHTFN